VSEKKMHIPDRKLGGCAALLLWEALHHTYTDYLTHYLSHTLSLTYSISHILYLHYYLYTLLFSPFSSIYGDKISLEGRR